MLDKDVKDFDWIFSLFCYYFDEAIGTLQERLEGTANFFDVFFVDFVVRFPPVNSELGLACGLICGLSLSYRIVVINDNCLTGD